MAKNAMAADQNVKLIVHLKSLGDQLALYRAAHIHVSELEPARKTRTNLSRAIAVFHDLRAKHKDSNIFLMKNADIVFLAKAIPMTELLAACQAVEAVFVGDVGVDFVNIHGGEGEIFTLFNLETDQSQFMRWAELATGLAKAAAAETEVKGDIDLEGLSRIKDELQKINISSMLFNQPVHDIASKDADILFLEMYVSVQVLEEMLCPGLSLTSRRWLFTDLTEELDYAVMRYLAEADKTVWAKRLSININLSSLASPRFNAFDADLPVSRRNKIVLEINKTDIIENMRLYRELVPFLRERGYKILLDGLSFLNVSAIDFSGIDCDYAKIFWSTEILKLDPESLGRVVRKFKNTVGPKFLLARCDSAQSVRFARNVGINLAQGRMIDSMVRRHIPF